MKAGSARVQSRKADWWCQEPRSRQEAQGVWSDPSATLQTIGSERAQDTVKEEEKTSFYSKITIVKELGNVVDHDIKAYTNLINVTVGHVSNCTIDPQGYPTWSSETTDIYPRYRGRVEFYTLNASLLLYDVQISDSGIYTVAVSTARYKTKETISVWVHTAPPSGISVKHEIKAYTNAINVTVGQSVLLPVTYTLTHQSSLYTIEWIIQNRAILYHSVSNYTIDSQGYPTWINGKSTVYPMYEGRVEFYTLNASLLLYNLQIGDSGIYTVTFSTAQYKIKENISIWVHSTLSSGENATRTWIFAIRTVLCFVPIGGLVAIFYIWEC
ncbi:uncharacterized protein LOC142101875 [Mixophyes fleayi]|uniref:uncharacterized protein LOC142101875 n=1 Tax=Mixophyes fleayi TaxID=3061075 RepID=UPI003F4E0B1C